jgi:hypothetical protein
MNNQRGFKNALDTGKQYDDGFLENTPQVNISPHAMNQILKISVSDPNRLKNLSILNKHGYLPLGGRRSTKKMKQNKKKHKKLSRRRRHYHSKKNRKSMKRK